MEVFAAGCVKESSEGGSVSYSMAAPRWSSPWRHQAVCTFPNIVLLLLSRIATFKILMNCIWVTSGTSVFV